MARTKRKNVDTLPKYAFHDIRLGDTGRAVAFTQWVLKQLGWYTGEIDGVFGQKTLSAVRKFQSSHNLTVSGVVDRTMRYSLFGEAVDKGVLKAMPTPYYVNNWTSHEQTTETSHETTPGTGTSVVPEQLQEAIPRVGTKLAPTSPEYTHQLPREYHPEQQTQTNYGFEGTAGTHQASMYPQQGGMQPSTPGGYDPGTPGMPYPLMPSGQTPMQPGGFPGMMQPATLGMSQPGAPGMMQPGTPGMIQPGTSGMMQPQTGGTESSVMELPYGMTQYWQQQLQQSTGQQMREWFNPYFYGYDPYLRWDQSNPYYPPYYAYPYF
jgi:peptidoglycan hydrolase-like protein with peptidoglycan-binding domain